MVVKEELESARLKLAGSAANDLPSLSNCQEEADSHVISHNALGSSDWL